jgi:hypothetical protein
LIGADELEIFVTPDMQKLASIVHHIQGVGHFHEVTPADLELVRVYVVTKVTDCFGDIPDGGIW